MGLLQWAGLPVVVLVLAGAVGLVQDVTAMRSADNANLHAYGVAVRVLGKRWPNFGELMISPRAVSVLNNGQKQKEGLPAEEPKRHPSCEAAVKAAAAEQCGGEFAADPLPVRFDAVFANLCIATRGRSARIVEAVTETCNIKL
eukprot:Hpha_TRINITY_DN24233_c0_g1::TRINITY_DN24233_c0_g1_i1::g.36057::m.36057